MGKEPEKIERLAAQLKELSEALADEEAAIRSRFLCRHRHPDVGGSHESMAALNRAWEQA